MTAPKITPEGKAVLFLVSTGERFERWPVDARAMLNTGEYTTDDPSGDTGDTPAVPVAPDPVPHVTQAAALNAAQSPTGAPLIVAPAGSGTPAAPVTLPTERTIVPKRGRGK